MYYIQGFFFICRNGIINSHIQAKFSGVQDTDEERSICNLTRECTVLILAALVKFCSLNLYWSPWIITLYYWLKTNLQAEVKMFSHLFYDNG